MFCGLPSSTISIVPRAVVVRAASSSRPDGSRSQVELSSPKRDASHAGRRQRYQCRVVNGEPVVFEINPRFSGGIR